MSTEQRDHIELLWSIHCEIESFNIFPVLILYLMHVTLFFYNWSSFSCMALIHLLSTSALSAVFGFTLNIRALLWAWCWKDDFFLTLSWTSPMIKSFGWCRFCPTGYVLLSFLSQFSEALNTSSFLLSNFISTKTLIQLWQFFIEFVVIKPYMDDFFNN